MLNQTPKPSWTNYNQSRPGGGRFQAPAPYIRPEIDILDISAEHGFAGSGPTWDEDPTIDGENPLDPYGPQN